MKASSATPPDNRSVPPLLTALPGPQCDVLFELSTGGRTPLFLGRMLTGRDAGRLVTLRRLPDPVGSELRDAAERARGIAHPQLAKALGVLRIDGVSYFASEYIPGVTLFELLRTSMQRGHALGPAFAVRVVLDALRAAAAAVERLGSAHDGSALGCLYPESIWIAEFGETLLSEVLVSACLVSGEGALEGAPEDDIDRAGSLLLSLISGVNDESSLDDPGMPPGVAAVAARARGLRGARRFTTLAEFVEALSNLGPALIATELEVSSELASLMGPLLELRRQKLEMMEREAQQDSTRDETKCFRAPSNSGAAERETARPPPEPGPDSVSVAPPQHSRPPDFEDPEEPTLLYRSAAHKPQSQLQAPVPSSPSAARVLPESPAAMMPVPPGVARAVAPAPAVTPHRLTGRRTAAFLLLVLALSAFVATSKPLRAGYSFRAPSNWVWLNGARNRVRGLFR